MNIKSTKSDIQLLTSIIESSITKINNDIFRIVVRATDTVIDLEALAAEHYRSEQYHQNLVIRSTNFKHKRSEMYKTGHMLLTHSYAQKKNPNWPRALTYELYLLDYSRNPSGRKKLYDQYMQCESEIATMYKRKASYRIPMSDDSKSEHKVMIRPEPAKRYMKDSEYRLFLKFYKLAYPLLLEYSALRSRYKFCLEQRRSMLREFIKREEVECNRYWLAGEATLISAISNQYPAIAALFTPQENELCK
ncbi:hypothetical protein L4D20_10535 [Vibrio kyushuensis]|uniref:hypothetical protein n=1 Tax=Vibrio kyushuensis TaxID=2910249 RepID=UPI003D104770